MPAPLPPPPASPNSTGGRAGRRRTGRRRAWIVALGALVLLAIAATIAAVALFASALRAWIDPAAIAPYAAEPTVISVIDGDTVVVRIGRERVPVRLLGIDTPETKDPRKPVQCFGREASEYTAALLPRGTIVRLEHDVESHDAYGRLLAYVWRAADGLFVNLDLVRGGWADILSISPNTFHADELRRARDDARSAGRGLWQACGGPGRSAA